MKRETTRDLQSEDGRSERNDERWNEGRREMKMEDEERRDKGGITAFCVTFVLK